MGTSSVKALRQRARTVLEDWISWLPVEKDRLFDTTADELESCYVMTSVALDEAFSLRRTPTLSRAREQVAVSADLFDRLAGRLLIILWALEEEGRHCGTLPNVVSLGADNFRGDRAQHVAWKSGILSKVLFASRSRFFLKLRALAEIIEDITEKYRETAEEIAWGASIRPSAHWEALEVLHYDLNTCLRETVVVFKCFLCAIPNEAVQSFRQKLQMSLRTPPRSGRFGIRAPHSS